MLRGELGFTGMLVTDYSEITNVYSWHGAASSVPDAVLLTSWHTDSGVRMLLTLCRNYFMQKNVQRKRSYPLQNGPQ
eukprot:6431-Heterococcus_DN1.PRE.1